MKLHNKGNFGRKGGWTDTYFPIFRKVIMSSKHQNFTKNVALNLNLLEKIRKILNLQNIFSLSIFNQESDIKQFTIYKMYHLERFSFFIPLT